MKRVAFIAIVLFAATSLEAQTAPKPKPKPSRRPVSAAGALKQLDKAVLAKLEAGVSKLVAEARELDDVKKPKVEPTFRRPHSAIKDWGADMGLPALLRMCDDFTKGQGRRFRDTYVRWHLMEVVKKLSDEQLAEASPYLSELVEAIPGKLRTKYVDEYKREPPEVYDQYTRLVHGPTLRIKIGYPPFEKYVYAPESFEHMNDAQKAAAAPDWARAQSLRTQFKEAYSPTARAFNDRIAEVNVLVREYQGEVVYLMVRTGNPDRLKQVFRAIDKHARIKDSVTGFDLLAYVYLAAIDGHITKYDVKLRKQLGSSLEKTARSVEKNWVLHGVYKRNFADYAFHMVESLKKGDTFAMH